MSSRVSNVNSPAQVLQEASLINGSHRADANSDNALSVARCVNCECHGKSYLRHSYTRLAWIRSVVVAQTPLQRTTPHQPNMSWLVRRRLITEALKIPQPPLLYGLSHYTVLARGLMFRNVKSGERVHDPRHRGMLSVLNLESSSRRLVQENPPSSQIRPAIHFTSIPT